MSEAPSLTDALALGGLDFEVAVRPLYTRTNVDPALPDVFTYEPAGGAGCLSSAPAGHDLLEEEETQRGAVELGRGVRH